MKSVEPLFNNVLIKRDEIKKMEGTLHVPDAAQEKQTIATVIDVGPGVRNPESGVFIETVVKKGQKVLIGRYSGTEIKIEDEEFVMIQESEILGIVT